MAAMELISSLSLESITPIEMQATPIDRFMPLAALAVVATAAACSFLNLSPFFFLAFATTAVTLALAGIAARIAWTRRHRDAAWTRAVRAIVDDCDSKPRNRHLPVQVLPHLLLGDKASAADVSALQALGVTHVCNGVNPTRTNPKPSHNGSARTLSKPQHWWYLSSSLPATPP